eukprot:TRINITY_DN1775_c0_g1_i1.p1 TRINITY_DN1775_c0_g1~~TRINITY_DN1775_c0_g1_i1.p1  ORF type:complete len:352 (+),score=48.36 TRINITY_DN1775_c0_g1_i1:112-1167(+)
MAVSIERTRVIARHVINIVHPWLNEIRTVAVIGAPLCEGQSRGGVKFAPSAFRKGGIEQAIRNLKWEFEDLGDIVTPAPAPRDLAIEDDFYSSDQVKNSEVVGAGVRAVFERVVEAASGGNFVLNIGGDHSIASGTIGGMLECRPELAVLWVDAHGDCNNPDTSPSGNYHGMPLAHILGWFQKRVRGFEWIDDLLTRRGPLAEDRVALIALRDVDAGEKQLLRASGVHAFCMQDIDRWGIGAVMEMALERIDPKKRRPLHLSFDIDSCDPAIAPGTGTKARGGLSYREAHYICETMAKTQRLGSMDLVEVNPDMDLPVEERLHGDDPLIKGTQTVNLGIELVASALGRVIV